MINDGFPLDGFEVIGKATRGYKGYIKMTVGKGLVYFNKAALDALGRPERARLLVNADKSLVMLEAGDNVGSRKTGADNIQWSGTSIIPELKALNLGYDFDNTRYKFIGEKIDDTHIVFDLKLAEVKEDDAE